MEFRILGPLEVVDGGLSIELGGRKRRALLARLLLDAGRTVSVEQLVDDLWGDVPPQTATKMVQVYVSQLRKLLPEGVIETRPSGYAVEPDEDSLDLRRFDKLLAEGRSALGDGDAERASELLRDALALWRGPALAEFSEPFAAAEAARLEESRLVCVAERIEADLALGRYADVVGELELLAERHPLRERLRGQLMRALYGAGRQAEALSAFRGFRERLADELGMEPSAALKALERRMLRQDATLVPPASPRTPPVPSSSSISPAAAAGPEIRYARSGDVSIAYQVVAGEGLLDLVLVNGWICTFQPGWENPRIARFYRRLASLGRLILFDKRGTGLSDRVALDRLPDLETRMDDVRAVMDAAGSERAVVIGVSEGGPMSVLFAATHPERTAALVLVGTFARVLWAPDYSIGITEEEMQERFLAAESDDWALSMTLEWLGRVAPGLVGDAGQVRWYVSYVQRGASPAAAKALRLMNNDIDVRHVLPTVGVPTLALYRKDEYYAPARRYMADAIPGARVVELPGNDHLPWEGDQEALIDEVERFLGDVRGEVDVDRVLATVLFTDIVGSTARAVELGDRAWRVLLDRHHAVVRAQLTRFRGREVGTSGDGVFAVFDGPARAIRCASAIVRAVRSLGLEVRAGVHTGEVELVDSDVRGIAVHIGARVSALASPSEVLVSQTVRDLVAGSGLEFDDRGAHALAGVPGEWRVFSARDPVSA